MSRTEGCAMSSHPTERIVSVRPAYDCIRVQPCVHGSSRCIPGQGGSHGVHNAELHLSVLGPQAEITLVVNTGWELPSVPLDARASVHRRYPRGHYVEFHTARPRYPGQQGNPPRNGAACQDWAGCYVDQGYLLADTPTALLVQHGLDPVWAWLEDAYDQTLVDMDTVAQAPAR